MPNRPALVPEVQYASLHQQGDAAQLGMWVFLVNETIFFGSAASSTDVPSSSVTVTGNAGVGLGVGEAAASLPDGAATTGTEAAGDGAEPDEHAPRMAARSTLRRATPRRRSAGDIERVSGSGCRRGRVSRRTWRQDAIDPSLRSVEGGVRWSDARACLPFSRRFEHAPRGRRPDFRPRAVHRSGTVPESHRLRDRTASNV